ncbi:MAG: FHA domain-containing protein [Archangium sp.]
MAVPSYLSSFLWMQQLRGADAFAAKFPGEWLVWEPGHWQAPNPRGMTMTLSLPGEAPKGSRAPATGDSLCFHLGLAAERSVTVGREPSNELVVNDGTVSRSHAVFFGRGALWNVKPAAGRAIALSGTAVPEGGMPLLPGKVLVLGGVQLSFHDFPSLVRRLGQAATTT